MRERAEPALKLLCAVLVALFLVQLAGVARRFHPLKRTRAPEPASWSVPVPTNAPAGAANPPIPMPPPPRMRGGPGGPGGPGAANPNLTPEVRVRLDRIVQSEILGQVVRPPPMALLGIAGKDVFLRAPNGQAGVVHEGGELGGVQIVRIGINRVLVRENGEEKELMIFEGMGGESLLPKRKEGTP